MNRVGLLQSSLGRAGVWAFLMSLSFLMILGSSLGNRLGNRLGNIAWGQSAYTLGFAGQTTYNSDPAGTVKSDQPFDATLAQTGGTVGEQGWSISMTMENGLITAITTAGTAVSDLSDPTAPGFNKTELTKGAGNEGAVSAVVLSLTTDITVPVNTTATIGKLKTQFTIPTGTGKATLKFVDNRKGSGQPVQNAITENGDTKVPKLGLLDLQLVEKGGGQATCCGKNLILGFSPTKIKSTTQYDGIVDSGGAGCTGQGGTIHKQSAVGDTGEQHVFAGIASKLTGDGAQGWSFSIESTGDIVVAGVTTAGTAVADLSDPQAPGFNKTEIIDPAKNPPGRHGAVSAVVLSLTTSISLPAVGTDSVLDLDIKASKGQTDAPIVGTLAFVDNLKGSGQPVQNAVTVNGNTETPCNGPPHPAAGVTISFEKSSVAAAKKFRRGNPNNDSKINIADAIWIINELFRSGPKTACPPAADINGDGKEDASDALFLINYEFKGGTKPPAPFSETSTQCGTDPASATCPEDQNGCT